MCRLLFQTQNTTVIRQQNTAPPCKKKVYNLPTPQAKQKDFEHDRLKNTFA